MVYFPTNFPVELEPAESTKKRSGIPSVYCAQHSDDKRFLAILTSVTVYLWGTRPLALQASFKRSEQSVLEYGQNIMLCWTSDSQRLVVGTQLGYLLFLQISVSSSSAMSLRLETTRVGVHAPGDLASFGLDVEAFRASTAVIHHKITALVSRSDEIMVATTAGVIERFSLVKKQFDAAAAIVINTIKFSSSPRSISGVAHIVSMSFQPSMKSLAVALSNGRAGLISTSNFGFDKDMLGHWVGGEDDSCKFTCVALNSRFRLLAVGQNNGDVRVYSIEAGSKLVHSHTVTQYSTLSGMVPARSGSSAVSAISFTDDGYAMAVGWKQGGVRVWSVFGFLLMSSTDDTTNEESEHPVIEGVSSLSWGPQGYSLMAMSCKSSKVMKFSFVKSSLTNNSTLANQFNVTLQGESQIYINPDMGDIRSPRNVDKLLDLQWQTLQVPAQYLDQNLPIRFVAAGPGSQYIAVAGRRGVAHFSRATGRWRLFGNQTQEQALECVGGIVWWNEYLIVPCKTANGQHEVRFFPRNSNLDNRHMTHVQMISREILLLNVCGDRLIVYTSARRVQIFTMSIGNTKGSEPAPVLLQPEWELDLRDHVPYSANVLSMCLNQTQVSPRSDSLDTNSYKELSPVSLVVNVAGKIFMFPFENVTATNPSEATTIAVGSPALLAIGVENFWGWAPSGSTKVEQHHDAALWFGCGARGMYVWLPLHRNAGQLDEDTAKWIMLPFNLNIFPLSVLFSDVVILGASHDVHHYSAGKFPCYALERKTQIYLHHILRQLLRRDQDSHAMKIAEACQDLPYFSHVVELMLHEVLENEAGVFRDPENALMPKVAAFIKTFPNYLDIIVRSARKTEMAKWKYLFSVVGEAKSLFEECIRENRLDTASSYLIILQSLESPTESAKLAVRILKLALLAENWRLAKDLVRFLQATSNYSPQLDIDNTNRGGGDVSTTSQTTYGKVFAEYALQQLRSHRIRAIGRFAASLPFPLLAWLKSVRAKDGLSLDFEAALVQVFIDFPIDKESIGYPLIATPKARIGTAAIRESSVAISEIVFLMNIFFETKFLDWAWLCSVILQDEEAASRVLEEIAADEETVDGIYGLMKRFQPVVEKQEWSQYKLFFEMLSTKFRSALPVPTDLERQVPNSKDEEGCRVS